MRRTLFVALIAMAMVLTALPASAVPKSTFDVPVDCPSGSFLIRFVDNQGSIVGFDEQDRPVLVHILDVTFSVTVTDVNDELIYGDSVEFGWTRGSGKGLAAKIEHCTFDDDRLNAPFFVDEEFASSFERDFGTDALFGHIGETVNVLINITGSVGLTMPGR